MEAFARFADDIYAVDAGYVRPLLAAIHLIVERERVAIVDTGGKGSLAPTLAALATLGLTAESVDYVVLTHIHLDHAGGAGNMMRAFPHARLVVHPRGVAHMVAPARLIQGVTAVYGAAEVERLYGQILPIDAARIIPATHELTIDLAGRPLLCLDTPGHARHHIALFDQRSRSVFTGDIFGMAYRELDTDGRQFLFPSTSPVQFDPPAMHASIDLLLAYRPQFAYLTHYSQLADLPAQAIHLRRRIDAHVAIALQAESTGKLGEARHEQMHAELSEWLLDEVRRFGCPLADDRVLDLFATDLELNARGLAVWLDSRAA